MSQLLMFWLKKRDKGRTIRKVMGGGGGGGGLGDFINLHEYF